jgi:flagellar biosynthesis protein
VPDTPEVRETAEDPRKDTVAVALAYRPESDAAPKVLASGRGGIAEQILEVARARDIHVREDADLVQLLQLIEVGDEIPVAAFAAVAEILIYIYRANGGSPHSPRETHATTAEHPACP